MDTAPTTTIPAATGRPRLSDIARRCVSGAVFGMFVDTFDVYLPALVLPAAMSYFQPRSLPPAVAVTITTLLFCISLLGRPIGSVIFGNLADRIGRKRVTLIAATGFTVTTLLIALLPGYAAWGYLSVAVFAALRLIDGIFLAGGYAAPIPLALERSPRVLRGRVGGLIAAAAPGAFLVISLIQVLALTRMAKPAFISWGWRIPFFLGVLLGIAYLIHYWRIPEGDEDYWAARRAARRQPVRELFSGTNAKAIAQVFVLTSGYWFAAQMAVSLLPSLLVGALHRSSTEVSWLTLAGSVFTIAAMLGFAAMGQRIGRRPLLIRCGIVITVATTAAFYLMVRFAGGGGSFLPAAVMGVLVTVLTSGPLGVLISYLNERFPITVRSTGYSVGYTFGLILPGLYSFWLLGLRQFLPYSYTPLVLIVLGGLLMIVGVYSGPETNQVESLAAADGGGAR